MPSKTRGMTTETRQQAIVTTGRAVVSCHFTRFLLVAAAAAADKLPECWRGGSSRIAMRLIQLRSLAVCYPTCKYPLPVPRMLAKSLSLYSDTLNNSGDILIGLI